MRLKKYLNEQQCPLGKIYGGIPSVGGYGSNVEFEVGLANMAEAAHCILGSLHNVYYGEGYMKGEKEHIKEEFNIIKRSQKEYSKDLYVGKVFPLDSKHGITAIESIKKTAPKLIKQAEDSIRKLDEKKYPKEAYELALRTYMFLKTISKAGLKTVSSLSDVKKYPVNYLNSFEVNSSVKSLGKKVDNFIKSTPKIN